MKKLDYEKMFGLLVYNNFIFNYNVLDEFLKLYGFDGLEKLADWLKSKGEHSKVIFIYNYIENVALGF